MKITKRGTPQVKHCTIDDLGIAITGEDAKPLVDAINEYCNKFASTGGTCPKCNAKLGGLLGSFAWGLCHGEGVCTGGLKGSCGWPCRAYHRPKDADGKEIFNGPVCAILAYHPEFVTQESSESEKESLIC